MPIMSVYEDQTLLDNMRKLGVSILNQRDYLLSEKRRKASDPPLSDAIKTQLLNCASAAEVYKMQITAIELMIEEEEKNAQALPVAEIKLEEVPNE